MPSAAHPSDTASWLPADLDALLVEAVREATDLTGEAADQLISALRALVRPAWLLTLQSDGPPRTGGSRIGGLPDLPHGWQWPIVETRSGPAAPVFVAQINLAEVPRVADAGWLPPRGWLWFFHDGNNSGATPDHLVLHADVPVGQLRTVTPPPGLPYLDSVGPEIHTPEPVSLVRTLFLYDNFKTGWTSNGYDALADALEEQYGDDLDILGDIQDAFEELADPGRAGRILGLLLGKPTPCPPPGGACPCGRTAANDTPGYDGDACAWASDALFVAYGKWGDGPLVFTADATVKDPISDGRWLATEAWIY
jgi:hypothetical protein